MANEFYFMVFGEYKKRLQEHKDDIFPFAPLSFIQINQLAILATTVAEDMRTAPPVQFVPAVTIDPEETEV